MKYTVFHANFHKNNRERYEIIKHSQVIVTKIVFSP